MAEIENPNMNTRKAVNPLLRWLWDMVTLYSNEEIRVSSTYHDQVADVKEILRSDVSGIVNSVLDFAINCASVDYTVESNNEESTKIIENWLKNINISLIGRVPTGAKALSREYYRERWKNSSFLLLRSTWDKVNIGGASFILPTKMWFLDGLNIEVRDNNDARVIGEEKYYIKITDKKSVLLPTKENELIFVQKPFDNWSSLYPTPFVIQRGLWKNLKGYDNVNKKSEKIVGKALEYLLTIKKGTEGLAMKNLSEYTYSTEDLKKVKDDLKGMIQTSKSEAGVPIYATNFDTEMEHLIPEYSRILNEGIYVNLEKRLLAGCGLIDVVDAATTTRRESVLNPKAFIRETETGANDFISLLEEVMKVIVEKNKAAHPKYFSDSTEIQLHYTPIRDFISDSIRDHLRSMYDRGVLSKQTYAEVIGGCDIDIEVKRRKQETKEKLNEVLYPPIIQNKEESINETEAPQETKPEEKTGPEAKNFKSSLDNLIILATCKKCGKEFDYEKTPESCMGGTICPNCKQLLTDENIAFIKSIVVEDETNEDVEKGKIVKRKDGWHVLSEKTEKNLGGPYKTKKEAIKRLREVEFFKHRGDT